MARFSSNSTTNFRSISLPSRSHPTTLRVEEELIKLKSWKDASISNTSANTICSALLGLQQLYKSIDDFLNLPLISQPLPHHQKEKWVDDLLDKSVRFLDICGVAKEIVSQCKENVRDVQSSLRRKKGSESLEKYFSCRRKLKKDIKTSVACLKQIDQEINGSDPTIMDLDHNVSIVIRVLKEANSTSIIIFQLVLKFLSAESSKQKTNRWTMVAGLVQKGRFGSEDQKKESFNELENVDAALSSSLIDHNKMIVQPHIVHNRLENLEGSLEILENELMAMSRCLIRSRTTLLNVFSC